MGTVGIAASEDVSVATARKTFYCTECEARVPEMVTRCPNPDCRKWNTIKEGVPDTMSTNVVRMKDIDPECTVKVPTGLPELDAALDGGTIPGQVVLVGGPPGVGKSTLVLAVAHAMTKRGVLDMTSGRADRKKKNRVLLISSEEDVEKIRARSLRIKKGDDILLCHNRVITEIEGDFATYNPEFGIIDSLNKIKDAESNQGAVTTMGRIYDYAHATSMTTFVLCHVNGDGEIAGMLTLQHAADTVMMLDRDRKDSDTRTLRVLKNRHGSEDYVGLFEMTAGGLVSFDPTKNLDTGKLQPGQAFAVAMMGGKCFPIEVQALTQKSERPQLSVVGYPSDRVRTLLAVLNQRTGVDVSDRDVYIQILGGLNFSDTAIDTAIAMAIVSAVQKRALPARTAYVGELDLLGRVKAGGRAAQRHEVAERHKFKVIEGGELQEIIDVAIG